MLQIIIAPQPVGFINNLLISSVCLVLAAIEVAHQQLQPGRQSDDTGDAAVFVEHDGYTQPAFAHAPEQDIGLDALEDKIGLLHRTGHSCLRAALRQGEIVLDVNAHDLVCGALHTG